MIQDNRRDDRLLDEMLHQMHIPEPTSGAVERILAEARSDITSSDAVGVQISAGKRFYGWISDVLSEMVLPKPAYALAVCLMVGLFVGWGMPSSVADDGYYEAEVQTAYTETSFLYDEDEVL